MELVRRQVEKAKYLYRIGKYPYSMEIAEKFYGNIADKKGQWN